MMKKEFVIENEIAEIKETTNREASLTTNLLSEVGFITPEMHSAVGDGVTDDTTAIQNCFTEAIQLGKGIAFTSGKIYKIKQSIDISGFGGSYKEKLVLGNAATILVDFDGFAFNAVCQNTADSYNCTFKNVNIKANIKGVGGGVNIDNYQLFDFEDCTFENLKYGLYTKDIWYQNILKCQFVECKLGMVFDVENTSSKKEINNVTIEKCRMTTGVVGIYIKGLPHGFRILNNCIESYQYGLCGYGLISGSDPCLWVKQNYFELNTNHIYMAGLDITESDENSFIITKLDDNAGWKNVSLIRNYFIGGGAITIGIGENRLKENRYNATKEVVVNVGTTSARSIIYTEDDVFFKAEGNGIARVKIYSPNGIIAASPYIYNKLARRLRRIPYFTNGLGKKQVITNTDMLSPLYDGSFNPDESLRCWNKSVMKINGTNINCTTLAAGVGGVKNCRFYLDSDPTKKNTFPAYHTIDSLIALSDDQTINDSRYFVDKTSGMLIDYAGRSYKGTIYGTVDTNNPAYGTSFPEIPVQNEIFYNTTEQKYYMWDTDDWYECHYAVDIYS